MASFGYAIDAMEAGWPVKRTAWGVNTYPVYLLQPEDVPAYFSRGPVSADWRPSHTDMLAKDWEVVQPASGSSETR